MTVRFTNTEGCVRALLILADDLAAGRVETFSIEHGLLVSRMCVVYYVGRAGESLLPDLPGVTVGDECDEEADTEPGKGQRR